MRRQFVFTAALLALPALPAAGSALYAVQSIPLPATAGYTAGAATMTLSIDDAGAVTGTVADTTGLSGFIWQDGVSRSVTGPVSEVQTEALGINDSGTVVGVAISDDLAQQAFSGSRGGAQLLSGGISSAASAINDHGEIAGAARSPTNGAQEAVTWFNGSIDYLEPWPQVASGAVAINQAGAAVGFTAPGGDFSHRISTIWQNDTITLLPSLGGGDGVANGINDSGQVVGESAISSGDEHAFLWQNDEMIDLGALPGEPESGALAINESGLIVGFSTDDSLKSSAVLWENGELIDLNTLLPANSGWQLQEAFDINNAGEIVGTGIYDGQSSIFLLTPTDLSSDLVVVPEPSLAIFAAVGLLGVGRRRRFRMPR